MAAGSTATSASITAFTYAGYGVNSGGDSLVFTFGNANTTTMTTPAVTIQADPLFSFLVSSTTMDDFIANGHIAQGSATVP